MRGSQGACHRVQWGVTSQPGPVGCKQAPAILSSKLVGAVAEDFSLQNANNAVVVKFYMCRIMTWNIKREGKKNTQLPRTGHIIISFFPFPLQACFSVLE